MQAIHRIRVFRRRSAHRDVFSRFARRLEEMLDRPRELPRSRALPRTRPNPRVRTALR